MQVTRLVMLDITHMCRRPVSLLDTDIVSRLVAPMCRCPVSPPLPPPRVRRVVQTVSRPPRPPTLYPDLAACVARKQAAFALPEADIPASLTWPAAEILCRFLAWLVVTGHHVTMLCCRRGTKQLEDGVIFSRDVRMTVPSLEQLSLEDHLEIARKVGC